MEILIAMVLIALIGFMPRIKEMIEVELQLREACLKGTENVEYKSSTLKHIKKMDKKLGTEFKILVQQVSMIGEFWADDVIKGYGINLECDKDFNMFLLEFKEMLDSPCPYDCQGAKFLNAFEQNYFFALKREIEEQKRQQEYKPYEWLGKFLPEVAMDLDN